MINQWISNLIGVVILATLLEMVLPNGNLKKYTKFFIGLITILIILQPIIKLTGNFQHFTKDLWNRLIYAESEAMSIQSQVLGQSQEKYIMEQYKSRLEQDVVNRVEKYIPDLDVSATVTLDRIEDKEILFSLIGIEVNIGSTNEIRIEPVEIGIYDKPPIEEEISTHSNRQDMDVDFDMIKEDLSTTYEIDKSRIYITMR